MWLPPKRRAHSLKKKCARASRIEGGCFSKCGSRLSAAHTRSYNSQGRRGFPRSTCQKWCLERFKILRAQQLRWLTVLKSREWRSGTI
eukprot:2884781-Pyramimonas_sp.AAC.1